MIRKILSPVNQAITHVQDWTDEKLRHLCGGMTPEIRLAVILFMLLFFGGLSIYFTVSSIYRIGKEDGETIRIDSVSCNFDVYPYAVATYARQMIIRESSVTERSLVTRCRLLNAVRSDNNPHGFMMESFEITENKDLNTIKR